MTENEDLICEINYVDIEKVKNVSENLISEENVFEMSELFKVLGDSTRLKIISSLLIEELCVCDIANILGVSVSAVSHQLRILKNTRLVRSRRAGKMIYYSLIDEHISVLIKIAKEHILE
jgi:DNA-binding transcriptional ArsR family regulator